MMQLLRTFVQLGPGAISRAWQAKVRELVSVTDFGAVGDGVADDTAAFQAALTYIQSVQYRPTLRVPAGIYKITTGLVITGNSVKIVGDGDLTLGGGPDTDPAGAVLRYYGAGTALTVGVAPGVNGSFIVGVCVKNLRIELDNNAACGLYVWQANRCYFSNIAIFGNKGAGCIGLHIAAGISNIYERINVHGGGRTPGATTADYVAVGLQCDLGYLNDTITTTIFRRCYFHYCNYAVKMNYSVDFEDCVFESSAVGAGSFAGGYANSQFLRCWFEGNNENFEFSGGSVQMIGGRINSFAGQTLAGYVQSVQRMSFDSVMFSTTHASPLMFSGGNYVAAATGRVEFRNCQFPANMTMGGVNLQAVNGYAQVVNKSMEMTTMRFTALAVTGTVTPVPRTDGAGTKYVMARAGHLLGYRVLSTGPLTGGSFNIALLQNGAAVPDFTANAQTASVVTVNGQFYKNQFAAGDIITPYLSVNGLTSTTDFIMELVVAYGPDGTP